MADLDYNTITIYPGNYDDYMLASAQSRERALKDNAKAKEKLQDYKNLSHDLVPTNPKHVKQLLV